MSWPPSPRVIKQGAIVALLVVLGGAGWWGRQVWSQRLTDDRARALAEQWVAQHKSDWLNATCLQNFDYVESPTRVGRNDRPTLNWLAELETLKIYEALPDTGTGSRLFQHGSAATKYLRNGRLCLASDVEIKSVAQSKKDDSKTERVLAVELAWKDWADFDDLKEVQGDAPDFLKKDRHELQAHLQEGVWTLSDAMLAPATAAVFSSKPVSLEYYKPLPRNDEELLYIAYAANPEVEIDFDRAARYAMRSYRLERDEFRKRDMLKAFEPIVRRKIDEARRRPYYYVELRGRVNNYNFDEKYFRIDELDNNGMLGGGSYSAFGTDSRLYWSGSNRLEYSRMKVEDEQVARVIESLIASQRLRTRIYFRVKSADVFGSSRITPEITGVQMLAPDGAVLVEM